MGTKFGQEVWNLLFVLLQSNVDRERAWRGKYGNRGIVKEEEFEGRAKEEHIDRIISVLVLFQRTTMWTLGWWIA